MKNSHTLLIAGGLRAEVVFGFRTVMESTLRLQVKEFIKGIEHAGEKKLNQRDHKGAKQTGKTTTEHENRRRENTQYTQKFRANRGQV